MIACGVFAREIGYLLAHTLSDFTVDLDVLDSRLHMNPRALQEKMEEKLRANGASSGSDVALFFGDCHPRMKEICAVQGISRAEGINCGEILLGNDLYRELRSAGAFLLFPEWAGRWREIFVIDLGFSDPEIARSFMKEHHKKFVYLDTGIIPVPLSELEIIKQFFELPVEVRPVSLDNLEGQLRKILVSMEDK